MCEESSIPQTRDHVYLADRRVAWPLLGASLAATTLGGTSTVVLASFVARHGLAGLWLDLPLGLSLMISGFLLAPRVRRTGASSIAGVARLQFGREFGVAVGVLVLTAELAWFALLTLAGATLVTGITGWNLWFSVLAVSGSFSLYTVLGGQRAVIRTDLIQILLVLVFGLGIPAVLTVTGGHFHPDPALLTFPTGPGLGWKALAGLALMMGLPGMVGGDVYGRLLSARSPGDAGKASVLAGAVKVLAAGFVAVIALGSGGDLYGAFHTILSPSLRFAAVFSILMAIVSSADSVLLTGATVLHGDLLHRMRVSPRLVIAGVALTGTCLALLAGNVVKVMEWSYAVFSAGAPLPMLSALWLKRPPSGLTAALSVGLGGGTALVLKVIGEPDAFLWGFGLSGLFLMAGILFRRRGG